MSKKPLKGRHITLRDGSEVLVDEQDFAWLNEWEWHLNAGYAACGQRRKRNEEFRKVLMHRVIMKCAGHCLSGDVEVDHINRNKLDNRRSNLRVVSRSVNQHNGKLRSDSSTGYKGVTLTPQGNYLARIQIDGTRKTVGRFDKVEDALLALENERGKIA